MANLKEYLPRYYDGSHEMDELTTAENYLFDNIFNVELESVVNNQYIATADENAILSYEQISGIIANTELETLEFRRERLLNRFSFKAPYTMNFLINRLDSIIGKGKYTIDMDYQSFTLTVEASASNQAWAEEILIMVGKIKPANIIFRNTPLVTDSIKVDEKIAISIYTFNYRVGTTARTSDIAPIAQIGEPNEILGAEQMSILSYFLNDQAAAARNNITYVMINDTYMINDFVVKEAFDNVLDIQYIIPASLGIGAVTNIKIYSYGDVPYTNSSVYFIVTDDVQVKHSIPITEGT